LQVLQHAGKTGPRALKDARILLVEDDADTREGLAFWLETQGAHVTAVGTAEEAVRAFEREPPEVVLSDIGLPGEDGFTLVERLGRLGRARGHEVPAVAVTAFTSAEHRLQAMRSGFRELVPKPVDVLRLVALLSTCIEDERQGAPG
jgi:CheY-like chemotaxis protein